MQTLTRAVGQFNTDFPIPLSDSKKITRILVSRPNHRLGNLLLMTPLLQEIERVFPHAKVDLFIKGDLAPLVFRNYPSVDQIIQLPKKPFNDLSGYLSGWLKLKANRYDLAINVVKGSSSGRLSTRFANADYRIFGDSDAAFLRSYPDYEHLAKAPVYSLRTTLAQSGYLERMPPVPPLNLKLTSVEKAAGKVIGEKLTYGAQKAICLFTNATGDKLYPADWWVTLYERIKEEFPECAIIEILPIENTSKLSFRAPTFSHSDIRVVGALIANMTVFIAADSGMMHLGSATPTPTIGLFKVTEPKSYEPYSNRSQALDTNHHTLEDLISVLKTILYPEK